MDDVTVNTKAAKIKMDGIEYLLKEMVDDKLVKWYHYTIEASILKAKHYRPKADSLREDIATLLMAENYLCYLALNNGDESLTSDFVMTLTQNQKAHIVTLQNTLNSVDNLDKIMDLKELVIQHALENFKTK